MDAASAGLARANGIRDIERFTRPLNEYAASNGLFSEFVPAVSDEIGRNFTDMAVRRQNVADVFQPKSATISSSCKNADDRGGCVGNHVLYKLPDAPVCFPNRLCVRRSC